MLEQQPLRIGDCLRAGPGECGTSPIWQYKDRIFTLNEVDQLTDRIASGLLSMGYRCGDRLAILALNQPEWLATFLAAAKIGVVVVGLSTRYQEDEISFILSQSEARGVMTLARSGNIDYAEVFSRLVNQLSGLEHIFLCDGAEGNDYSYKALVSTEVSDALEQAKNSLSECAASMIIYTSGTTGKPKGATLSHRSLLASARAQVSHVGMSSDDSMPLIVPLNHVAGLTCSALACLIARSTAVMVPQFSPKDLVDVLNSAPVSMIGMVPTMYTLLLQQGGLNDQVCQHVRILQVGAAAPDTALVNALKSTFPNAKVLNSYGMSESSGIVVMSTMEDSVEQTVSSVGLPLHGVEACVVNQANQAVACGEVGELCVRGDVVMLGYFGDDEKTQEVIDSAGWLHTGDLASMDALGRVYLKGRNKEMYIQGGFNVYPIEVENVLKLHPEVDAAAGIGVPDTVLGEVGKYFVVRRLGSSVSEEILIEHCNQSLANYKVPRQIVFRDELPMTPTGKVQKNRLS